MSDSDYKRNLYGRRQTRALGHERLGAMDNLFPALAIPAGEERGTLDPRQFFDHQTEQIWFEIGFGNGEHVAALMQRYPDRAYLAAEPFVTGMAAFLRMIEDRPERNVRVWMDDAILLTGRLAPASLDGLYILNPDPWPKSRHEKRRVLCRENLDRFARVLKPGGALIAATDHAALADWIMTQFHEHPDFTWTAERADDWRQPPADWIPTRYEEKGRAAGRQQVYLIFKRN